MLYNTSIKEVSQIEPIYVIHKDGKRWDKSGRKIAYLKKGSAKGVITNECHEAGKDAARQFDYSDPQNNKAYDEAFEAEISRFEIVEYTQKDN